MKPVFVASAAIFSSCFIASSLSSAEEFESKDLNEVIVVAARIEQNMLNVPASVEILAEDAINMSNIITVDELFKTAVGVDLQGSGFPGSPIKLNMRGLTPGFQSKRVLVLVDGRRLNDEYQGNAEFALLPADSIQRIEIIHGPASALYGSNAMGGVINIITRKGTDTPITIIEASGGSYNTQHYKISHGAKFGSVNYFITGSHVETDGYLNNEDGTDRNWRADNTTFNIGTVLNTTSEIRLHVGAYLGKGSDEESDRESRKNHQMLIYTLKWNDNMDACLIVRAYQNASRDKYDWKYPGVGIYDQQTLAGEIQQSFWVGNSHRVVIGGEFRQENVDIEEVAGPINEATDTTGLYLQDEILIGETINIMAGIRNDANDDYADAWSPRLGALWHATKNSEIFASVNRAWRAPGMSDRFVMIQYMGMTFQGNPDLDPEILTAYEIGMRHRVPNKLNIETVLFYNDMKDSFDFIMDTDGVFRNRNATHMITYGIEAGVRYQINETYSIAANYSYTDGEYEQFDSNPAVEGNQPAYLAPHKVAVQLDFLCPLGWKHSWRWRYVDARFGDAQNDPANKMDDYMTVDWRLRIPVTKHADLTLNLDNLFDEKYREFPSFNQPGLIIMAGAEVTF
ncbi:MAG: TonB-dependent receptor [Lentisphaerae bacterium]|nr:TonB-dependent receptor [Lentisphaerota bacterium]